jgi:hypothetical protein
MGWKWVNSRPVEGCYEHGDDLSGYINCNNFIRNFANIIFSRRTQLHDVCHKEIWRECGNWTHLTQARVQWLALVNRLKSFQFTEKARNILTGWATVIFWKKIL